VSASGKRGSKGPRALWPPEAFFFFFFFFYRSRLLPLGLYRK
jgi:hypothetical protein